MTYATNHHRQWSFHRAKILSRPNRFFLTFVDSRSDFFAEGVARGLVGVGSWSGDNFT